MRRHANRPHAGTAAAVRNRERLVQVEVADVGADRRRARQRRPARSCSRRPCTPGRRARGRSRRSRGCGPRTRRACSDTSPSGTTADRGAPSAFARRSSTSMLPRSSQATMTTDMPASAALAGLVPCADCGISATVALRCRRATAWYALDHQQAGELALRAGVRLQRHGREAGDLGQRRFELAEDRPDSPPACSTRHERMHARELRPAHRHHLGRGVELHRARARAESSPCRARCPCVRAAGCTASSRSRSDAR